MSERHTSLIFLALSSLRLSILPVSLLLHGGESDRYSNGGLKTRNVQRHPQVITYTVCNLPSVLFFWMLPFPLHCACILKWNMEFQYVWTHNLYSLGLVRSEASLMTCLREYIQTFLDKFHRLKTASVKYADSPTPKGFCLQTQTRQAWTFKYVKRCFL